MSKKWHEEKCVFCSLCTVLCPCEVFQLNEGAIEYLRSRCTDCKNCVAGAGCPRGAIDK